MKKFFIIIFCFLVVLFQMTSTLFGRLFGTGPNLVLVLSLTFVFLELLPAKWWSVVGIGLLADLFSGLPYGLMTASLVIVIYLVDWLRKRTFSNINFWVLTVLTFSASLVFDIILFGLVKIFDFGLAWRWQAVLIESFINTLIAYPFFYGAKKIFR